LGRVGRVCRNAGGARFPRDTHLRGVGAHHDPARALCSRSQRMEAADRPSVLLGALIGLTGAGGQMLLFHAVHTGPTYLIFPLIALSPVVTIAMSLLWLQERTTLIGAVGIVLALAALPLFDYQPGQGLTGHGVAWFLYSLIILAAWGV